MEYYNGTKGVNATMRIMDIDYNSLDLKEEDLYNFLVFLGYEESESLVNEFGYSSWTDFLDKNNFKDNNGNPSIEMFKKCMESNVYKKGI